MVRSPDWKPILTGAVAGLEPGEQVSVIFGAMIPHEFFRGHVMTAELVPLLLIMDHVRWRYRTRAASRSAQIPLAPRMIIAVTGRRLVIWAARRRWRPGNVVGDLARDRIIEVNYGGTGSRPDLLVLHLTDGETLTLRVSATQAAELARRLRQAA